jgi:ribose transport system permease protein
MPPATDKQGEATAPDRAEAAPISPLRTVKWLSSKLEIRMLALAVLIAVTLSLSSQYFLTANNVLNLLDQSVVVGVVAIGMTFIILTGGIDLSVGAVAGLTGIVFGLVVQELGLPLGALTAILAGGAIGLVSGVLVGYFGLAAFVVTLGMMSIGRSLCYIFSGGISISTIPEELSDFVYIKVAFIPMNVLVLILLYLGAWLYLGYTKGGRTIYAIGSNAEAARTAGLNVVGYSILPYVVAGALSAVSALLLAGKILSVDPLAGNLLELDAIAAVVIGGASLFGGRGSIIGTLIGVFIMVMIRNGLNLLGVSPFWQGSAIGAIIIAAVLAERLVSRRSSAR